MTVPDPSGPEQDPAYGPLWFCRSALASFRLATVFSTVSSLAVVPVSGLNATASRPGAEVMAQLQPGANHRPLTNSRLPRDPHRFASP